MIKIYNTLPICLQNVACSLHGYKEKRKRYSLLFNQKLADLETTQWYSKSEIEHYQNEKLHSLIQHAYTTVPYYHDLFKSLKLTPADIKTKHDLRKLPILTKEIVRSEGTRLLSTSFKKRNVLQGKTSGSTGKALSFYTTKEAIAFQWAVWWRLRHRCNVFFEDYPRHLNFTGRPVVPATQNHPPFWRYNHAFNQVLLPMQKILPSTIPSIVNALNQYLLPYYIGYPSIISHFCSLLEENKLKLNNAPKFVFSGCEKLYLSQKNIIEKTLRTKIYDQYGFSEGCCNASQCEHHIYHEDFEFGIFDIYPDPQLEDKQGRIIGTGFANMAMPLINYKTGDIAKKHEKKCKCGRNTQAISSIEGRNEDYILTPEGNKIMRFDYLFKDTFSIKESQIIQYNPNEITIRIIKHPTYSSKEEQSLKNKVKEWISPTIKVNFDYITEIERTKTGKFRSVISMLNKSI